MTRKVVVVVRLQSLRMQDTEVTIIYLTTGEAGIPDKSHDEAAAIRRQEAINACKILNAKPVFAGQIDGDTIMNNDWLNKMQQLISSENPDIVFTHWPIDSHKDHQIASLLTIQTWMRAQQKFPLYFFEVCAGEQTMTFHPTDYIDYNRYTRTKTKSSVLSREPGPRRYLWLRSCFHGRFSRKRTWCKSRRRLCKNEWKNDGRFSCIIFAQ
jgi:LmbE family N-acetylglucosaminyl deacetylase